MAGADPADPYSRAQPLGALGPMPRRHQARRADAGRPPVLRRQGVGRGLRGRARASRAARREDRRDRYRAVLRDRAPALRRALGGGALHHRALADRVQSRSRCIRSPARSFSAGRGRARSTPSRRSTSSRSCVACAITRSARSMRWCCRPCPPPTRWSRCSPIRSSSTAGSAPTPISSTCSISAALAVPASMRDDGTPFGVTLLGARRPRRAAGVDRARVSCRYRAAARRHRANAAAARQLARCGRGRRHPARGGRRASLRHAAQRRIDRARRDASWRRPRPRPTTGCLRSPGRARPSPGCCASRPARARRSRSRSGRCRPRASAASSRRCRRRCRSAR